MPRSKSTQSKSNPTGSSNEYKIEDLVRKQLVIKGRLEFMNKHINSISVTPDTQTLAGLELRIQNAAKLFDEFHEIQKNIEESVDLDQMGEQMRAREEFENDYYSLLSKAQCILKQNTQPEQKETQNGANLGSIKLPIISLPSFDGESEHWLEYRDTFLSLVHESTEITDIQKFHYLKSSLQGSAKSVIEAIEFSSNNYKTAWELLLSRYDNNRMLVQNHVKSLFAIDPLTTESSSQLRNLIDNVLKNLRALNILGEPTDSWDTLIIYLVTTKLDRYTEREWERYRNLPTGRENDKPKPTLEELLNFLKGRADMLDTLQATRGHSQVSKPSLRKERAAPTQNKVHCLLSREDQVSNKCPMCKENHHIYSCKNFLGLSSSNRKSFILKHKMCINCLRPGHVSDYCKSGACKKCGKKHNTLLHTDKFQSDSANHEANKSDQTSQPISSFTIVNSDPANLVMLPTAVVKLRDSSGKPHAARVLLDNGSERCFISKALCERLKISTRQCHHQLRGVGGVVTQTSQICNISIRSRVNSFSTKLTCYVINEITPSLPNTRSKRAEYKIPKDVKLADPNFNVPQPIDILIGADKFWQLLSEGRRSLPNGPTLQNTVLGWIISGPVYVRKFSKSNWPIQCNFSQSLEQQLRKFWEIEEVQSALTPWSEDELHCEQHFVQNTTRNAEGRFCVKVPLKESPDKLGDSYEVAKRRFLALERKLNKSPNMKRMYTEFMREYLELGHMSKINSYGDNHYFLPHHGVLRESSTTTKLRVVFDASAATSTGKSLNDIQHTGPPIQGDLFDILLRFRQYKYTACADIEKMYRQCLIHEDQRNMQLILWRENQFSPIQTYQLNTVTYGTASAPFLSIRCLKQCAADYNDDEVKSLVDNHFYVDDLLISHDDKDELVKICQKATAALKSGCFPLRKWRFNFKNVPDFENTTETKQLVSKDDAYSKTLGIAWSSSSDQFHFSIQLNESTSTVTKRIILSNISKIFDPLGLLSPTIILAKIILQKLWLVRVDWDEPIPSDLLEQWKKFICSVQVLKDITIPRHVMTQNPTHISLHIFTDASQSAYGTCIYVRTVKENQSVTVRLLCSKGKVAPLKPISIPRLELCGACLGARLYDKVRNALQAKLNDVVFWTDSTIVLGWLRMAPGLLKPFVQHRTSEIQEITKGYSWRHVSGKENPADLVSRGLNGHELTTSSLWWNGPNFLSEFTFNISNFHIKDLPSELPEMRSKPIHSFAAVNNSSALISFQRFSQLNRLKRTFAFVLRFITNVRKLPNERQLGDLDLEELQEAEFQLARIVQHESFPVEYKTLKKGKSVSSNSKLSPLNPFYDERGLIRVGGRIQQSTLFEYNKKHPIVLSGKHHFSRLLIKHVHKILFHASSQAVLYYLRETWWLIGGRSVIKKVIHDCMVCKRFKAKPASPIMGNLPANRITPCFPFMRCGVDYAGPVLTLNRKGRGAKPEKSYICLFICFTTRAVHLELVSDLSSNSYLLALKRFISRRGKPAEIYSDNGKNFVGAMKEFRTFLNNDVTRSKIHTFSNQNNIKFHFIPPYSPHFGGLWEAGVKACKHHLLRVVRNARLTFEELYTTLTQIEGILNSRPLSPMSSDANDLQPLTPGHFLIGRTLTAPFSTSLLDVPMNRLSRYQMIEQIRQNFWERWSKEYISELQTRVKWRQTASDLQPGMLVAIKEDNLPPLHWRLGRIISTIPGKDNVSRIANIRTATGNITRAFSKICPLFIEESNKIST